MLKILLKSGGELSLSSTNVSCTAHMRDQPDLHQASLIPPVERIDRVVTGEETLEWVLIVEKDVFHTSIYTNDD